jgi:spore coat protein SA
LEHKVYHLLSETEPFSEYRGGAISRWAANVLRADDSSIIICPSTDDSWGFPAGRVVPVPRFDKYEHTRKQTRHLPWALHKRLVKYVLLPAVRVVGPGDILWVHNRPDYAFVLAPYVHKAGGKVVLHMHNSHLTQQPKNRILAAGLDHFVFVSEFLQQESQTQFTFITQSTILYNGANESMFFPPVIERPAPEVPEILFASRLVKEKGAHVFLEAMRRLMDTGVKAKGIVVGASHFGGSKITGYIAELHSMAPANVEFRPYCSGSELAEMFRNVDIFCLPSVWQDPFPLAPLEAMASRLPVVATESGGIPEAFAEGGALLVERGSVEQLVSALTKLIASPDLRKQIANEGCLSFHRNWTWSVVQRRYRNIVDLLAT